MSIENPEFNLSPRLQPDKPKSDILENLMDPTELQPQTVEAKPHDDETELTLSTRLTAEKPLISLKEPEDLSPTPLAEAIPTATFEAQAQATQPSEQPVPLNFESGDSVHVRNAAGELEPDWLVGYRDGGMFRLVNSTSHEFKDVSAADLITWNTPQTSGVPEITPQPTAEDKTTVTPEAPVFHNGQSVAIKLSDGTIENDWIVKNPKNINIGYLMVERADGSAFQFSSVDDLHAWNTTQPETPTNSSVEVQTKTATTEQEPLFHDGQTVTIHRTDGTVEDNWLIKNPDNIWDGYIQVTNADDTTMQFFTEEQLKAWNPQMTDTAPVMPAGSIVSPEAPAPEQTKEQTVDPAVERLAHAILSACDAGGIPTFISRGFRAVLKAYGFTAEEIGAATPSELIAALRLKVSDKSSEPPVTAEGSAPQTEPKIEALERQEFSPGQPVRVMGIKGQIETDWVIVDFSYALLDSRLTMMFTVKKSDGSNKRNISAEQLHQWNPSLKSEPQPTPEKISPERYSTEWVADTLKQFNIDPTKLAGFNELTPGQQALAVENFQQIMTDTVQANSADNLKANRKGGVFGKVWRSAFKGIYLAKGQTEALADLEVNDGTLKETVLQQLIAGLQRQRPEVTIEQGQLNTQYLTAKKLGLEGEVTSERKLLLQQFNQAASSLARTPAEWQLTGNKEQQLEFQQKTEAYEKLRTEILQEISKTQDAPAVELAVLEATRDIRMQQFLSSHPDVEEALLKMRSPKIWAEALKSTVTERGLYLVAGSITRAASVSLLGALGIPIAAGFIGGWRANQRGKETLKERDRLARKGVVDASDQADTIQAVEIAGGKGGLATKLIDLQQRIATETNKDKLVVLQGRLMRRIRYTNYKLEEGLVNFGSAETRVVNHYKLMAAMGEATVSTREFKPRVTKPEIFSQLKDQHEKIDTRLNSFLDYQFNTTKKIREDYITKETIKGATLGAGFAAAGYLITHFADHARPDHSVFGQENQPSTRASADLRVAEVVKSGDSVWKLTERYLSEQFKDKFAELNEAQKTYLIDAIKDKFAAHPEQFGLHAGQSIDQISVGQTITFDSIIKDPAVADLIFNQAHELQPEQMANIVHNNDLLHHWISNNPNEALTADNVAGILDGTHQVGLTPEILEQIAQEGGKNILTLDHELSNTTINQIVNQALYGHPAGQEALMAQIKEALQDNNYLASIQEAQHYDPNEMTTGWLTTHRGQDWLEDHNGEVWQQNGQAYTVVQETATSAKKVAEKAVATATDIFESVGAPEKTIDLVNATTWVAGKKTHTWGIFRLQP